MGLINQWCLPDLEDRIGSNDGTNTGSDDGQELDKSKLRTFKDFVSANSDKIDFGDCGNVKSLVIVVSLDSTTQSFLMNNTNGVSASSGTLSYTDFDNAFVDGVDTNTITTGWHCVVITSTTDVACSNLELGHIGATYGDFKCAYLATYSEDLSAAQIQRITEEQLYKVNSNPFIVSDVFTPGANTKGYFKFDGDATDSSGNGKNGTATSMTYPSNGIINQCGNFDGSASKIVLSSTMLSNAATAFTMSCWVKFDTSAISWIVAPSAAGFYFSSTLTAGKLSCAIYTTGYILRTDISNFADTTNWNLFTYTWSTSQGNGKLYLNGRLIATSSDTRATAVDLSGQLTCGVYTGGTTNRLDGQLDELIFEDKCWTADEVALYAKNNPYRYLPPKNTIRDGLVNEYFLDSPDGVDTVSDYQGTNDGTKGGASKPTSATGVNGMKNLAFATNGRVTVDKTSFQYTDASNFSVSLWFKSSKLDANTHALFCYYDGATTGGLFLTLNAGEQVYLILQTNGGTNYKTFTSTGTYCDGKWHMVTYTYASDKTVTVYIDGQLGVGTPTSAGTLSGNFYSANALALFGQRNNGAAYELQLNGSIAYLANYNRVLSALEVDKLYRDTFIN